MCLWESQFLTKRTPRGLDFALIKNQTLAVISFCLSEMDLTEPQLCLFTVTLLPPLSLPAVAEGQPPSPANPLFHPISVHSEKRFQGFIPQATPCSPAFGSDVADLHLDVGFFPCM